MARISISATIQPSGVVTLSRSADPYTGAVATVAAEAAITADITAAEANVTISGNGTALGLVQQIGTDFTTLTTALAAVGSGTDVVVSYNPATVLSKNQLRACLSKIVAAVLGQSDLS